MASFNEENFINEEINFDIYEIDDKILKTNEYIQDDGNQIKYRFKFLIDLPNEKLINNQSKRDFPKYFSKITGKNFKYTGILSSQLKKVKYGHSIMENGDEYLGEYKNDIREGFGIYIFHSNEEENDIYVGYFSKNIKTGNGIYLKINKVIKDNLSGELNLIN